MIQNKTVTINKTNQFEMGWTLFSPYSFDIDRNPNYFRPSIKQIVNIITYADTVNIILKEACLPSSIVQELEWVSSYSNSNINIVVKDESILERYTKISFSSKRVDRSVDVNYLGIIGKYRKYFVFAEDFTEIDNSVESLYFSNRQSISINDYLNGVKQIMVINSQVFKPFDNLINLARNNSIEINYITNSKVFDRNTFDYAKKNNINLFISDKTTDSILLVKNDKSIYNLCGLENGKYICYPVERLGHFIENSFICLFKKETIDTKSISGSVYSCFDGVNKPLDIKPLIIVNQDVHIKDMSDFINGIFDTSIVEQHNNYSNRAASVEYRFCLIPPLYDSSYVESSLYNDEHVLHNEWNLLQSGLLDEATSCYRSFMNNDCTFSYLNDYVRSFNNTLSFMVKKCNYNGYYKLIEEALSRFNECRTNLLSDCGFMFNSISSNTNVVKFDKFDAEIEGYRKTIADKNALIQNGVDVLSNKRRVEILYKKIDDLLELKKHFENTAESRGSKNLDAFLDTCRKVLDGKHVSIVDNDSIGKIVNTKEANKETLLNSFIDHYLFNLDLYLNNCITILEKLKNIDIPENYAVYEKENQRYIVIDDLDEYVDTKDLQNKYLVKCLARRSV